MTKLALPQARIPIAWAVVNGVRVPCEVDIEWMRLFFGMYDRAGGANGVSTTDLAISQFDDSGIPEAIAAINELESFTKLHTIYEDIPVDKNVDDVGLKERVTALEAEIQAIKQSLTVT